MDKLKNKSASFSSSPNFLYFSFFDEPEKSVHVWDDIDNDEEKTIFNKEILLSDYFYKKKAKSKEYQKRYYIFCEDCIYYKKDENSKTIIKIMKFDNIRVLQLDKQLNFIQFEKGFKLIKTNHISEIYTDDLDIFQKWKNKLSIYFIQSSFHQDFDVKKILGKGSFAKVYLVSKFEDSKEYAVKGFNKEKLLELEKGKESLINEIKILRKLDHKNISKLYGVYETQNSIYLVMDLLKGGEIIKKIKEKSYDELLIARILFNLLEALQHIHNLQIMHRDLKPENILIFNEDDNENVAIADFGLASFCNIEENSILFKRCGTPGYIAPEILKYVDDGSHKLYNHKCDIFSLGVIFYYLLTGKKPFNGENTKEILKKNKECSLDFTQSIFYTLRADTVDLLQHMLLEDPKTRISAKKAMQHPFFKIMSSQNSDSINLDKYDIHSEIDKDSENRKDSKIDFSLENLGSLSIFTKKALINEKSQTFEKNDVQIGSNMSIEGGSSFSPMKSLNPSKFGPVCLKELKKFEEN